MYTFLYDFNRSAEEGLYDKYLPGGEGLIERQLRILQEARISEIKIAGNEALFRYCQDFAGGRKDFRRISFEYIGTEIKEDMVADKEETYLFLAYNLFYAREDFQNFLAASSKYAIASFPRQAASQELAARIDMDWIVELGADLEGIDTCGVFPMIKINPDQPEEDSISAAPAFNCQSNREFLCSFINSLAKDIKGILWFDEEQGIGQARDGQVDAQFAARMAKEDYLSRKVISGQGHAVYIKQLIERSQARNVMLVCDELSGKTALKELLHYQEVAYKEYFVSNTKEQGQALSELVRALQQEQIDLLLAVGGNKTLELAQDAREQACENRKGRADILLAAMPAEYGDWSFCTADDWILDSNIAGADFIEEEDKAKIYLLMYRALCALLREDLPEKEQAMARRVFSELAKNRSKFFTGNREGLQAALYENYTLGYFSRFYGSGLEQMPHMVGQAIGVPAQDVAAVAIPYLVQRFYAHVSEAPREGSSMFKRIYTLELHTRILREEAFGGALEKWSQDLANRKIYFSNKSYASYREQIMRKIRELAVPQDSLITMEDLQEAVVQILSYSNRKLKPQWKFIEPENEEEQQRIEEAAEEERLEKIKNLPLKKRIFLVLKRAKFFREMNNLRKKLRYILYQFLYPVQTKWVVFESYGGTNNYGCNTRAIYESMLQDPDYFDYKFIWAFNNVKKFNYLKQNPHTVLVKRGSKRYIKFCARSKYIFTNTGMPKYIKPNKEQKMVYTWHGKPLKRIGCSFQGESEGKRSKRQLMKDYTGSGKRLSILTSPSPVFTPIMADAYNLSPKKRETAMLETGYPRNDYLFRYTQEDVLRIKMNLGIPLDKKVILYAPTWRPYRWIGGKSFEYVPVLDLDKLHEQLGDDYVFLCRLHHLERGSMRFDKHPGFVYDVSMVQDVNELYIISDTLVSDYSGTVFDFANLCRPIVFFMYDMEEYVGGANGLNFDLDFLPGPIVETQEEMVRALKDQLAHFVYDEKYQKFNEACNCLDGADCAYRTSHQIVEVNPPETKKQKRIVKYKIFGRNTKLVLRGYFQKLPFIKDDNTRRIESFRNKYKGQRCFLIGNGPSLRLADLNMLKDEICFGCNMIYKVFERTDWRPTFLCASDRVVAQAAAQQLQANPECTLWVSRTAYDLMKFKGDNLIYVSNLRKEKFYVHGDMTEYYVPSIATVMTFMVELAMYMGFSEIYLLGVDFTIGRGKNDHFMNSYRDKEMTKLEHMKMRNMFKGEDIGVHDAQIRFEGRALYAYEQLEKYAKKHGYHVYNATRGGMLEVFERADLDEVAGNKSK